MQEAPLQDASGDAQLNRLPRTMLQDEDRSATNVLITVRLIPRLVEALHTDANDMASYQALMHELGVLFPYALPGTLEAICEALVRDLMRKVDG